MKKILLTLILLSSVVTYAGDISVKTAYKNKNWMVIEVDEPAEPCGVKSLILTF
jgi:hypothetical protein